ncbi:MAG TPA: hypothetical protein VEZ16_05345 [Microvirga sp.]|nr:hypothetical protein [Microvirga sp.]
MEGQTMLRALSLVILMISAGPSLAVDSTDGTTVAQQQQQTAPQSTPRRGCEKNQEGIS